MSVDVLHGDLLSIYCLLLYVAQWNGLYLLHISRGLFPHLLIRKEADSLVLYPSTICVLTLNLCYRPLFASSLLSIISILLDQTRQDEMQLIGCQNLFDFVNNQVSSNGGYVNFTLDCEFYLSRSSCERKFFLINLIL